MSIMDAGSEDDGAVSSTSEMSLDLPDSGKIHVWRPLREDVDPQTSLIEADLFFNDKKFCEQAFRTAVEDTWSELKGMVWTYMEAEETWETSSLLDTDALHIIIVDIAQFDPQTRWRGVILEVSIFDEDFKRIEHWAKPWAFESFSTRSDLLMRLRMENTKQVWTEFNGIEQPFGSNEAVGLDHGSYIFVELDKSESLSESTVSMASYTEIAT